jgi:hypothetical protein
MIQRRDVILPPSDVEYLDRECSDWEILRDGAATWLLISNFPVPTGYDQSPVTVALRIEPGYPDTQIDMVYFSPEIRRLDGKSIRATETHETIRGESYQRWSRHRTPQNRWRSGEDDIQTHLLLVAHWLEREFAK